MFFSKLSDCQSLAAVNSVTAGDVVVDQLSAEAYERRIQRLENEKAELARKLNGTFPIFDCLTIPFSAIFHFSFLARLFKNFYHFSVIFRSGFRFLEAQAVVQTHFHGSTGIVVGNGAGDSNAVEPDNVAQLKDEINILKKRLADTVETSAQVRREPALEELEKKYREVQTKNRQALADKTQLQNVIDEKNLSNLSNFFLFSVNFLKPFVGIGRFNRKIERK